ncbi:MAG: hypothetical protein KC493_08590 [Bacteriovoracaceae bacterium]|nr:hypothetical protein [Bacteriovoracaceae bacterium]
MDTLNDFTEIRPKFRGFLTKLLADAFLEESYEPLPEEREPSDAIDPNLLLQSYAKPFT